MFYTQGNTLIAVTFTPGEAVWTEITSLPKSLYGPRASLVGARIRLTGGRSTDSEVDYRPEVIFQLMEK